MDDVPILGAKNMESACEILTRTAAAGPLRYSANTQFGLQVLRGSGEVSKQCDVEIIHYRSSTH